MRNRKKSSNLDEGFDRLSTAAADIKSIKWESGILSIAVSNQGAQGVLFIETNAGSVVFKATDEVSVDVFLTELARELGLHLPTIHPIEHGEPEYKHFMRAVEKYCHSNQQMYRIVTGRLNRPFYELIEFVRGVQLPSIGYARFQKIFAVEENLLEVGRLIGFDMIVNNSDRFPLYWGKQGNIDNVIFQVRGSPVALSWQQLASDKELVQGVAFGRPFGIDTRPTIIDPNEQLAKKNFERMLGSMRQFLECLFAYINESETVDDADKNILEVKQLEELNRLFLHYCNSMLSHEQLMTVIKGIVSCLNSLIRTVKLEGINRIRENLRKKEGLWEDSYWNSGLNKMHESYFSQVIRLLNAQWTVHEEAVSKILEYVYMPSEEEVGRPVSAYSQADNLINITSNRQHDKSRTGGEDADPKNEKFSPVEGENPPEPEAPANRSKQPSIASKAQSVEPVQQPPPKSLVPTDEETKHKEPEPTYPPVAEKQPKGDFSKEPASQQASPMKNASGLTHSKMAEKLRKFDARNG